MTTSVPEAPSTTPETVYRGVHAKHPMRAAALKGTVVPGDPHGDMTPEEHNLLDLSDASPFTSWTFRREIAESYSASRGPGGILLSLPYHPPSETDTWSWHESPDDFFEQEILLKGVRMGAGVTPL
jgi:hypothetical protein